MKERNDQLLFLSGVLLGAIGLVVLFFNHGSVVLGLEGLLLNKLGRSLFAWVQRYNNDRSGPMMLNNPLNKLICLLTSITMAWGGLAMMWFANQLLTYAFIAYSFIRGAIEGLLNSSKVTVNPDIEVVDQIVATYKQITARYPNAPEETILAFTVREVLTIWNAPDEAVKSIVEKNDWSDIHSVVDHLMLVRERLAKSDYTSHEFSDYLARSNGSPLWKMQVDTLLRR